MKTISQALIPAAGHGTRMRPFSDLLPKELVPLGSTPALAFVLAEARAAGMTRIGVVTRPDKPQIREYVETLRAAGELGEAELHYVSQREPRGLAEAIAAARDFLAGEPFALLLPDNLLLSPEHRLADLVELCERSGKDVIGALELDHRSSGEYGNCGRVDFVRAADAGLPARLCGRVLDLHRLHDKLPGTLEVAAGARIVRTCGRYVCLPHVHDYIERVRAEVTGEFSEVPVYQRILAERGALGLVLEPPVFDIGHPRGYLAAAAWLHRHA